VTPTPAGPQRPTVRAVRYKGEPLDSARGPGFGCFWLQIVVLAFLVVLTPLSAWWGWPDWLSATLLFVTIGLLLVAGQTIIFLLRLVAADRRSRRRPLGSGSPTVGEIEDAQGGADGRLGSGSEGRANGGSDGGADGPSSRPSGA